MKPTHQVSLLRLFVGILLKCGLMHELCSERDAPHMQDRVVYFECWTERMHAAGQVRIFIQLS